MFKGVLRMLCSAALAAALPAASLAADYPDRPIRWLVPFSAGPARCPGRDLVLLVTSAVLARLLERDLHLVRGPRLDPDRPLPGTLDHTGLRFAA